jgi:hypothetical protein
MSEKRVVYVVEPRDGGKPSTRLAGSRRNPLSQVVIKNEGRIEREYYLWQGPAPICWVGRTCERYLWWLSANATNPVLSRAGQRRRPRIIHSPGISV